MQLQGTPIVSSLGSTVLLDAERSKIAISKKEALAAAKLNSQIRRSIRGAAKNDAPHAAALIALLETGYLKDNLIGCQSDLRYCRRTFAQHQHTYLEATARFNARLEHVRERYMTHGLALLTAAVAISDEAEFRQVSEQFLRAFGVSAGRPPGPKLSLVPAAPPVRA